MKTPDNLSRKIKILVVDDYSTMRKIVRNNLTQLGFKEIEEAEDGVTALEKLKEGDFDLVISDWNMPNMKGIELLRAVKSDPNLSPIPFLMVTAESQKEDVIEATKAGVSNYIIKPFTNEVFKHKMNSIFQEKLVKTHPEA